MIMHLLSQIIRGKTVNICFSNKILFFSLVLYVNNQYVITDIYLNDGYWHYICASWSSIEGRYAIYVDANLTQSGIGISTGKHIKGTQNHLQERHFSF